VLVIGLVGKRSRDEPTPGRSSVAAKSIVKSGADSQPNGIVSVVPSAWSLTWRSAGTARAIGTIEASPLRSRRSRVASAIAFIAKQAWGKANPSGERNRGGRATSCDDAACVPEQSS
jgi:hypothetical protein